MRIVLYEQSLGCMMLRLLDALILCSVCIHKVATLPTELSIMEPDWIRKIIFFWGMSFLDEKSPALGNQRKCKVDVRNWEIEVPKWVVFLFSRKSFLDNFYKRYVNYTRVYMYFKKLQCTAAVTTLSSALMQLLLRKFICCSLGHWHQIHLPSLLSLLPLPFALRQPAWLRLHNIYNQGQH